MRAKKLLILFLLTIGLSACGSSYIEQRSLEYDNSMPASDELFVQEYTVTQLSGPVGGIWEMQLKYFI